MKLREMVHEGVDALDNRSLALVYEQVQVLLQLKAYALKAPLSPDEIADMLRHDTSNWSDDIIANREDRV